MLKRFTNNKNFCKKRVSLLVIDVQGEYFKEDTKFKLDSTQYSVFFNVQKLIQEFLKKIN